MDGTLIRLPIPELSEERRKELARVAGRYAEQARVAIRNVRRDGMEQLKRLKSSMSEDETRLWQDEIQEMTDAQIRKVDEALATREAEIFACDRYPGFGRGSRETRLDSLCEAVPSGYFRTISLSSWTVTVGGRGAGADCHAPRGHRAGAIAAQRAVEACLEKGIPFATFFALSTENWRRPAAEIGGILRLLRERLDAVRKSIPEGVRIRFVGDHSRLDRSLRRRMQDVEERTRSGTRILVSIAIGYGGRNDIVAAARVAGRARRNGRNFSRRH